jgi:hypothetical protein
LACEDGQTVVWKKKHVDRHESFRSTIEKSVYELHAHRNLDFRYISPSPYTTWPKAAWDKKIPKTYTKYSHSYTKPEDYMYL